MYAYAGQSSLKGQKLSLYSGNDMLQFDVNSPVTLQSEGVSI